ncbi:RICIN domain-containing protein, partial [Microcoleus sp. ZQ-A2]|nr:ricin-type beta-trefoil lectin domain protein [Microcoleus sp. FACHB-1]
GAPGRAIGTPLQLWDCETSGRNLENGSLTDQRWTFIKDGFIRNNLSEKCIDVAGTPGSANSAPLQLWDCETSGRNLENGSLTDQRWKLR